METNTYLMASLKALLKDHSVTIVLEHMAAISKANTKAHDGNTSRVHRAMVTSELLDNCAKTINVVQNYI